MHPNWNFSPHYGVFVLCHSHHKNYHFSDIACEILQILCWIHSVQQSLLMQWQEFALSYRSQCDSSGRTFSNVPYSVSVRIDFSCKHRNSIVTVREKTAHLHHLSTADLFHRRTFLQGLYMPCHILETSPSESEWLTVLWINLLLHDWIP